MSTNKWSKVLAFVIGVGFLGGLNSCKDDEPTLTDPPSMADAQFTYTTSPSSDNVLMLTASNSNMTNQWDFGNGLTGEGYEVTAEYPFAGEYTITLTVYNAGGSNSSSQVITIDQDDPGLLDNPLFDLLTGGSAGPGYKTWAVDSASDGHLV
jgi:PKD repeat protein